MAMVYHPSLSPVESPVCSICIANFNGEHMLVECIESVIAQGFGHAIEVIVHDDASTDASVSLIRERFPSVELLASQENVGFCVSNNRMADRARGEFILLLNNDAALLPGALQALLDSARSMHEPSILTLPQYDWQTGELVDRGCLLDLFYNPVPNLDPDRNDIAYVIGACLWCPRSIWHELGGFPEWIESIGEDLYLCTLARLRSVPVHSLSDSGYRHRQGASFGGNRLTDGRLHTTYRRRRLSERNKTFALALFTPTLAMWPLLGMHLVVLLAEGALVSTLRRDARLFREVYWNVPRALARQWKLLRHMRRDIQRERTITIAAFLRTFTLLPRKLQMLFRHGIPTLR